MTDHSEVQQAVDLYFKAINENNASVIPLADDVKYSGPMLAEPIHGEAAVRQHIADIAPFVARMNQKKIVIDGDTAAVILEFEGLNGVVIEGAEFFQVRNGKICTDQTFFDTRPLIKGAS